MQTAVSALGPKADTVQILLDNLIGALLERQRHVQAERLRSLEIDHKLELRWLQYWQVGRLQHYFAAVSNGMFAMMSRLGLTPEEIQRRQMSFAVVHAETDFHRELHSGDTMLLESTVLKVGDKSATFQHRLRNLSTNSVAMTTDFKCVLLDLGKREAIPIPNDIRAAAAELAAV